MADTQDNTPTEDLSALAWVHVELRRALETAHKGLRRFLRESQSAGQSDVDAVDPTALRGARIQLHQGAGALELVGMRAGARLLRAAETAVQRMVARQTPVSEASVQTIERASFALLDFLGRRLAGKRVSPVALFPQYAEVQVLAGADRAHPADLWEADFAWRDLNAPAPATVARAADEAALGSMEAIVLRLMRRPDALAWQRLSDLCADLAAGSEGRASALWQLSAAFAEAEAGGVLPHADLHTKRMAARLLAQLRLSARRQDAPSERLAQDLLFYCAHAAAGAAPSPRLAAVREAWRLAPEAALDYEQQLLGRYDPAWIAQARKRVAGAKDAWSAVAGGEAHRLAGLGEQVALVGDSIERLFPGGARLARVLQETVSQVQAAGGNPAPPLAMEVATAILYVDATLEDGELDLPELPQRVQRLAERVEDMQRGGQPQPLEPWMEELYRRVSDRQTMGSVVHELRASLSEVEKQIDQYFRDPAQRELLIPVPGQLQAMRGVFSVLGLEQASAAVLHMRDEVDALAQTEVDPDLASRAGTFDHLADNLGALSFLIDMLSVQPALAKSLFRFDAAQGSLSAVMGQSERPPVFVAADAAPLAAAPLAEQARALADSVSSAPTADHAAALELLGQRALAADLPGVAGAVSSARQALARSSDDETRQAVGAELAQAVGSLLAAPLPEPVPVPAPLPPASVKLEDDAEMREIFLEEAREVLETAHASLARLAEEPQDLGELTTVRRAFHTLKGSSRMVGLRDYGEAAWACEQLYNARLASAPEVDADLAGFTQEALAHLAAWTEAIAAGDANAFHSAPVAAAADALRLQGVRLPIAAASAGGAVPPVLDDALPQVELPELVELAFDPEPQGMAADLTVDDVGSPVPDLADAPGLLTGEHRGDRLIDHVPDLPLASDLELTPVLPTAAAPASPSFQLEFGDAGEVELQGLASPELPPVSSVEATLPLAAFETADTHDLLVQHEAPAAPELADVVEIDFGDFEQAGAATALAPPVPEPLPQPPLEPADDVIVSPEDDESTDAEEQTKVIGDLRIPIPLFNIYLNEADELSRRLCTELAEWAVEHERRPLGASTVVLAHSLAGSSATVGYVDLSSLARALEHALMRAADHGSGTADEAALYNEAAEEIRRLLHQFAAGFLKPLDPGLVERLAEVERRLAQQPFQAEPEAVLLEDLQPPQLASTAPPALPAQPQELPELPELPGLPTVATNFAAFDALPEVQVRTPQARPDAFDDDEDFEAEDAIDDDLFPIFEEEAEELLPQLQARLRDWLSRPGSADAPSACMRTLHTFKGGARLAGAMRLGEMAHRLETAIEHLSAAEATEPMQIEPLLARADRMAAAFDALRRPGAAVAAPVLPASEPVPVALPMAIAEQTLESLPAAPPVADEPGREQSPAAPRPAAPQRAIDWSSFDNRQAAAQAAPQGPGGGAGHAVRVRAGLLDRLVNQAGEVSITRARIDSDMHQLQGAVNDLTDNLDRLRSQLRDIELQADSQIASRIEAAKAASQSFDPLEMDRFTRFQELTRMMAESVNDVATVQRSVQRTLQSTEDQLAAQARLTRELQDDLLRTRMVEFESLADRLYRVVRQTAKDSGKQVRLDITGGAIEVDRGVLERMVGPLEHLLRNCVVHGIEDAAIRQAAGKDAVGEIRIAITQEGNEIGVECRDDGAGLDLPRIRRRAIERGLLQADAQVSDGELGDMIFRPGFSTAAVVTELAGRGVGLDVVRAEVNAMGGRIETASSAGQGTRFKLVLPLTTAVTQVVLLRCDKLQIAVPSTLVEVVRRVPTAEVEQAYATGGLAAGEAVLPFFWLGGLLQGGPRGPLLGRTQAVVVIRSAAQRVALHVDEVPGNQEVVVKHVGPQLARLPGLAGVTLLPSGAVAMIYNPVALAALYGEDVRRRALLMPAAQTQAMPEAQPEADAELAPLVLVVDDSLTVRRVTQRLLVREGYRVALAKDGLEAIERLAQERPVLMLTDIEMPRMDGFDLVRNLRADAALAALPVIMITSRIAQKHRDYAAELGVDHYLGKPYSE
ncbi:MAG: Hpt domain-containing protein, partial [Rubrivivax sp.]|nr:Hpt domain-containing protein [Rubrivivax sp.]